MATKSLSRFRATAFSEQGGLCYYCNQSMWLLDVARFAAEFGLTLGQAKLFRCTAEHLVPRCDGGTDARSNIVAACVDCNGTRHRCKMPLPPDRWRVRRLTRLARLIGRGVRLIRPG